MSTRTKTVEDQAALGGGRLAAVIRVPVPDMCRALCPVLLERRAAGVSDRYLDNVIAASAEGYPFPTNLDRDQPVGGSAPQTQADLVRQAVAEEWTQDEFESALDAQAARTRQEHG